MAEESKSLLATGKAKIFFGVTLLVGIVVGYFAAGYIPPQEDLAGTIGGVKKAEKYRAEQISEKDVMLTDTEIQKLLQDDKVQTLLKNQNFLRLTGDQVALTSFLELARDEVALTSFLELARDEVALTSFLELAKDQAALSTKE